MIDFNKYTFDSDCEQAYRRLVLIKKQELKDGDADAIRGWTNIEPYLRECYRLTYRGADKEYNIILAKWKGQALSELEEYYEELREAKEERERENQRKNEEAARRRKEERRLSEEAERSRKRREQERMQKADEERRRKAAVEAEKKAAAEEEQRKEAAKERKAQEKRNKEALDRRREDWQKTAALPLFAFNEFIEAKKQEYASRRLPEIEKEVSSLKAQEKERLEAEERELKEKAEKERRIAEEEARKKAEEIARKEAEEAEAIRKAEEKKRRRAELRAQKAKEEAARKAEEEEKRRIEAKNDYLRRCVRWQDQTGKLFPVDLGLSVKWASFNVGASNLWDSGDYFAWGETVSKEEYDWDSYVLSRECENNSAEASPELSEKPGVSQEMKCYCTQPGQGDVDNQTRLGPKDDAAAANLGSKWRFWEKQKWRMPTIEEFEELKNKCQWNWISMHGRNGYIIVGKNESAIFLPATGYKEGTERSCYNKCARYWSSTLDIDNNYKAAELKECNDPLDTIESDSYRYLGLTIRAVQD